MSVLSLRVIRGPFRAGGRRTLPRVGRREFAAMQRAWLFCLDLGEPFVGGSRHDPVVVMWCDECVAAAATFRSR